MSFRAGNTSLIGPDLNNLNLNLVYKIWGVVQLQVYRSVVHKIDDKNKSEQILNTWLGMDNHITTMQLTRGVDILEHVCGQMWTLEQLL